MSECMHVHAHKHTRVCVCVCVCVKAMNDTGIILNKCRLISILPLKYYHKNKRDPKRKS